MRLYQGDIKGGNFIWFATDRGSTTVCSVQAFSADTQQKEEEERERKKKKTEKEKTDDHQNKIYLVSVVGNSQAQSHLCAL